MRILIALKVPQWLLRIILSYLTNRKMILRFRNCCSHPKCMSGGCPQGTLIGVILYILYINPIGFPGEITIQISDISVMSWDAAEFQSSIIQGLLSYHSLWLTHILPTYTKPEVCDCRVLFPVICGREREIVISGPSLRRTGLTDWLTSSTTAIHNWLLLSW